MRLLFLLIYLLSPLLAEGPEIALVLGGGGVRGLAHVGVLEELDQEGIQIDLIVGCSVGSIIGALYAEHQSAKEVHERVGHLKRSDLVDVNLFSGRYGLAQGKALRELLRKSLKGKHFCELEIPLIVVATDLDSGEAVSLDAGPIAPAVHASSAFPVLFRPVTHHGRLLVDGGLVEPVPVSVARGRKPRVVIAVDVGVPLSKGRPSSLFGIARRSIEITYAKQSQSCVEGADVVIRPDMGDMGFLEDGNNEAAYQAGREATRKAIPQIRKLLAEIAS